MSRLLLLSVVMAWILSGCLPENKNNKPIGLIPRDSMISLLATMELNEAALKIQQKNNNRDSINKLASRSYDSLYSFYRFTPEQFKSSIDYYQNDLEDFQKMLDEVLLILTKERDSLQNLPKKTADTLIDK